MRPGRALPPGHRRPCIDHRATATAPRAATPVDPPTAGDRPRTRTGFGAAAYAPTNVMAKRIRARDRRCRFPGCTVAAVFCDLDHVRPWPAGPTHDTNLLCLCRRHHRVKQRPGWTVTLDPRRHRRPGPTPPDESAPPTPPTP